MILSFIWRGDRCHWLTGHRSSTLRFLACYAVFLTCAASALSKQGATNPLRAPINPTAASSTSTLSSSITTKQINKRKLSDNQHRPSQRTSFTTEIHLSELANDTTKESQKHDDTTGIATAESSIPRVTTAVETDNSRQTRRIKIAIGLVASISVMASLAKTGILPGPLLVSAGQTSYYGPYADGMILRDSIATGLAAVLAVMLVKSITFGYDKGWYDSKVGRKLNHTLAAPLFIAFFPAFSNAEGARFFAGLVTFSNMLRLYLAGTGKGESSLAQTISRSGDKKEVLGGPFIYVCLFQVFIWLFWRNSFVGVVAMSTMAAGDGMADLVGRKWGTNNKWSWSDGSKSKVGTLAFVVSASLVSFGLVTWLIGTECLESTLSTSDLAVRILLISFVTAFVELLPFGDDNYTVPGCAALMAALLLH